MSPVGRTACAGAWRWDALCVKGRHPRPRQVHRAPEVQEGGAARAQPSWFRELLCPGSDSLTLAVNLLCEHFGFLFYFPEWS